MKLDHVLHEGNDKLYGQPRSKPLTSVQAHDMILRNHRTALEQYVKRNVIYRGVKANAFSFVQPSKHVRVSRNTSNYYTILMDEILPAWNAYPKRSQSLVCTTSTAKVANYGNTCVVLPRDRAKIGVCPSHDIWFSFGILKFFHNLSEFNSKLTEISAVFGNGKPMDATKENFYSLDQTIKDMIRYEPDVFNEIIEEQFYDGINKWLIEFEDNEGMLTVFEDWLDPKNNNFKLKTIENFDSEYDREVWTDADCVLINIDTDEGQAMMEKLVKDFWNT